MKVLNIVCIVLACINAACAVFNIAMAKWHSDEKKYYEEIKAAYEDKLHELGKDSSESRYRQAMMLSLFF